MTYLNTMYYKNTPAFSSLHSFYVTLITDFFVYNVIKTVHLVRKKAFLSIGLSVLLQREIGLKNFCFCLHESFCCKCSFSRSAFSPLGGDALLKKKGCYIAINKYSHP